MWQRGRSLNMQPEKARDLHAQMLRGELTRALAAKRPDDEIKALRARIKEDLAEYDRFVATQGGGNHELALAVGVATFANPALGLLAAGVLTHEKWCRTWNVGARKSLGKTNLLRKSRNFEQV